MDDAREKTAGGDPLFSVAGRVAVIAGGMGQLGVSYGAALAERGAKVAVMDITEAPKVENPVFMQGMEAGTIWPFCADITDKQAVESVLLEVADRWGIPHVLVNNAALDFPPDAPPETVGPFETYPVSSFDTVMDVNVKGPLICCQVIGDAMAGKGRGSIINISSIYGILSPCQDIYEYKRKQGEVFFKPVAYSVSKSAILNLTRYLATYWAGKGVRVNTLTLAGVFNDQPEAFLEAYCQRIPIGRMARAEEMNGAILFLASDASSYMTGANMIVDGGWSAW
jgi:NAD(P)-dependent dehydrogenase (short-subunit alcohol dehydrogenase family)